MPASNTQSYINGRANVIARAAQLASDSEQCNKAARRFQSRMHVPGGVAHVAAAALLGESAVLDVFEPTSIAFKTAVERKADREEDLRRRGKQTGQS